MAKISSYFIYKLLLCVKLIKAKIFHHPYLKYFVLTFPPPFWNLYFSPHTSIAVPNSAFHYVSILIIFYYFILMCKIQIVLTERKKKFFLLRKMRMEKRFWKIIDERNNYFWNSVDLWRSEVFRVIIVITCTTKVVISTRLLTKNIESDQNSLFAHDYCHISLNLVNSRNQHTIINTIHKIESEVVTSTRLLIHNLKIDYQKINFFFQ